MQWVKKSTIYSNSKNVVLLLSSHQEKLKNVLFRVDNRQLLFVLFHRFFHLPVLKPSSTYLVEFQRYNRPRIGLS
jgi:hypothetical protein